MFGQNPAVPSAEWLGTLDDLSLLANTLLPQYLPAGDGGRARSEDVNPRLIRHYTTQGLLDPPLRQGKEARYTRRHLLQVLTLRRLMGEGHSSQALQGVLTGQDDDGLGALLTGEQRLELQPSNPALDFVRRMKAGSAPAAGSGTPSRRSSAAPPTPLSPMLPTGVQPTPVSQPISTQSGQLDERYTRLTIHPGLELHVARSYHLPHSRAEREALARQLLDALDSLRS